MSATIAPERPLPPLLTMKRAVELSGLSRTNLYRKLAAGELEARKSGRTTLVLTASLYAMLNRLPKF